MTDWMIKATELANCNCNSGCPCQFSQLPSDGTCEAACGFSFSEGHYGDVDLSGLKSAMVLKWPGPIHEGNGQIQLVIDENATEDQRAALETIMSGGDTEEMATFWYVFGKMTPTKHPTIYAPISLSYDSETGVGSVKVDGVFDMDVQPIANIVSGEPHRISIAMPQGFEFAEATIASGSTATRGGAIELLKNTDSHSHIANLHLTGQGVVRA